MFATFCESVFGVFELMVWFGFWFGLFLVVFVFRYVFSGMFERQPAPWLQKRSGARIESRFLRIYGIGESLVETKLKDLFHSENPTLALYCGAGEVQARISARVAADGDAEALIAPLENEIRTRLGDAVYGEGLENSMSRVVYELLLARGETVSCAES